MNQKRRSIDFKKILKRLLKHFGPQGWWPAFSPFEVCVGAILTQNAAWSNVERAIVNLKEANALDPDLIQKLSHRRLASLLRPSGYFNVKAQRLKTFALFYHKEVRPFLNQIKLRDLKIFREKLLRVNGIGRETADSILLYALDKPIFVIDAYTRRIFSRHQWIQGNEDYDRIRSLVEASWNRKNDLERVRDYNELHALLVIIGKEFCRSSSPRCQQCPLSDMLPIHSPFRIPKTKTVCHKKT